MIIGLGFLVANKVSAQGVAINEDGSTSDNSAILDLKSTTKGLLIPRMTTTQRDQISNPKKGLLVFDLTENNFFYFDGANWEMIRAEAPEELVTKNGVFTVKARNSGDTVLGIYSQNSEQITIKKDGLVGIGIAPNNKLDVDGNASVRGGIMHVYSRANNGGRLQLQNKDEQSNNAANGWQVEVPNTNFQIADGGVCRMNIQTNGRMAVGSHWPRERLDVDGNIVARGGTVQLWPRDSTHGGRLSIWDNHGGGNGYGLDVWKEKLRLQRGNQVLLTGQTNGDIAIGGYQTQAKLDVYGNTTVRGGDLYVWSADTAQGGVIHLKDGGIKNNSSGKEWTFGIQNNDMRISDNGKPRVHILDNGNMAVGNVTPDTKLDVDGNTTTRGGEMHVWSVDATEGGKLHLSDGNSNNSTDRWTVGVENDDFVLSDGNTNRMNIQNNGNMAVGDMVPSKKLDVDGDATLRNGNLHLWSSSSTQGGKLHLKDGGQNNNNSTNEWALDVQNNDLNISRNDTARIVVFDNGNVAIGNKGSAPSEKLEVVGNARIRDGLLTIASPNYPTSTELRLAHKGKNNTTADDHFRLHLDAFNALWLQNGTSTNNAMRLASGGLYYNGAVFFKDYSGNSTFAVGRDGSASIRKRLTIGTTLTLANTDGALVVKDKVSMNHVTFRHLQAKSGNGWNNWNGSNANVNTSINSLGAVACPELIIHSDERIKNIEGLSNQEQDLSTLMGIEITDYRFKDVVSKGHRPQKKVIAQQVKEVFPQAVSTNGTKFIPNIYTESTMENGWIALQADVAVGDSVKVITLDETLVLTVTAVEENRFQLNSEVEGDVFVYGKLVHDFHRVDYDAIAMLNVSATQALYKKLTETESKLAEVENTYTTELSETQTKLAELESAYTSLLNKVNAHFEAAGADTLVVSK